MFEEGEETREAAAKMAVLRTAVIFILYGWAEGP